MSLDYTEKVTQNKIGDTNGRTIKVPITELMKEIFDYKGWLKNTPEAQVVGILAL